MEVILTIIFVVVILKYWRSLRRLLLPTSSRTSLKDLEVHDLRYQMQRLQDQFEDQKAKIKELTSERDLARSELMVTQHKLRLAEETSAASFSCPLASEDEDEFPFPIENQAPPPPVPAPPPAAEHMDDLCSALTNLGYKKKQAEAAAAKTIAENPGASFRELVMAALRSRASTL